MNSIFVCFSVLLLLFFASKISESIEKKEKREYWRNYARVYRLRIREQREREKRKLLRELRRKPILVKTMTGETFFLERR